MDETFTFGGYPVKFTWENNEVYAHCKGVVGTLTQVEAFFNDNTNKRHYFGKCKIRRWRNHQIKIDCLEDSKYKFKELYEIAKQYKNEKEKL